MYKSKHKTKLKTEIQEVGVLKRLKDERTSSTIVTILHTTDRIINGMHYRNAYLCLC